VLETGTFNKTVNELH